MPEPYDPNQPLWKEGFIKFRTHPALAETYLFNKKVRRDYSFCTTYQRRDECTVRNVCEKLAFRAHLSATRWRDVVLFWGNRPLGYDERLCDALHQPDPDDPHQEFVEAVERETKGRFCLYGHAAPQAINRELEPLPGAVDYYDYVTQHSQLGHTYPQHPLITQAPPRAHAAAGPAWQPRPVRGPTPPRGVRRGQQQQRHSPRPAAGYGVGRPAYPPGLHPPREGPIGAPRVPSQRAMYRARTPGRAPSTHRSSAPSAPDRHGQHATAQPGSSAA